MISYDFMFMCLFLTPAFLFFSYTVQRYYVNNILWYLSVLKVIVQKLLTQETVTDDCSVDNYC